MQHMILVIKHGALGDIIFSMGAFEALREYHKKDRIILLTSSPFQELLTKCPYFDEIWIDDRHRPWTHPKACWSLFVRLKKAGFRRVYDLQRSKRSRWYLRVMKMFFTPIPKWSGIFKGCDFHYDIPSVYVDHILSINKNQLTCAGIKKMSAPDLGWMTASISFKLPDSYVLLVPGTSPGQEHKKWPASSYGRVAQHLVEKGYTPVILGTKNEREAAKIIQQLCPSAISLLGKTTLFDIREIAHKAKGAIGNDTGPMHLCYFSGCPSLFLFSHSSGIDLCGPREKHGAALKRDNLQDLSVQDVLPHLMLRE